MKTIRGFIFYCGMITSIVAWTILFAPVFLLSKETIRRVFGWWAYICMVWLRLSCGIRLEVRGRDKMLDKGRFYISKHQSTLETIALGFMMPRCLFIAKKELFRIPCFGWFLAASGMVTLDREGGMKSVHKLKRDSQAVVDADKPLIMFPEGTRKAVDAEADYKEGVYLLYKMLKKPITPVALNTGVFWPRGMAKTAGTAVFEFLPEIEAGLKKEDFMQRLKEALEPATKALVKEARAKHAKA